MKKDELRILQVGNVLVSPDIITEKFCCDLDATTIKQFLGNRFDRVLEKKGLTGDAFNEASLDMICSAIAKGHDCEKILRNLRFIRPDDCQTIILNTLEFFISAALSIASMR